MASRADWTWGVACSHAAMEEIDAAEHLAMTPDERLALVLVLSAQFDWSDDDGDDAPAPRLLGPACGVRRLRG